MIDPAALQAVQTELAVAIIALVVIAMWDTVTS